MRGTCNVGALTAVGNTERGFSDVSSRSGTALTTAGDSAATGRLGLLRSGKELDSVVSSWRDGHFNSQSVTITTIGDKLVSTATSYGTTDQDVANEFKYVPSLADRKGI